MAADLELGLKIEGLEATIADLAKLIRAQNEVGESAEESSKKSARGAKAAGDALGNAAGRGQAFGRAISEASGKVASSAAAFAGLANAIGGSGTGSGLSLVASMAGAVAQGAALGSTFGPAGAVIGAIVGAVPVITTLAGAHRDAATAAREQREQLDLLRSSLQAQRLEADIVGALADPRNAAAILGAIPEQTLADQRTLAEQAALAADNEASRLEAQLERFNSRGTAQSRRIRAASGGGVDMNALNAARQEREAARERLGLFDQEIERRRGVADAAARQAEALERVSALASEEALATREGRDAARDSGAAQRAAEEARRRDAEARAEMTRNLLASATVGNGFVRGGSYSGGEASAADPLNSEQIDMQAQYTAALEATKAAQDAARDSAKAQAEALAELHEAAKSAQTAFGEGYVNSIDEIIERWRDAREATQRAGMGMISTARLMERSLVAVGNNIAETIGGTMQGAFTDALGAWLDGSKSFVEAAEDMAKGVIKALTIESIVQAVTEVARAVASFASQDYAGGVAHLAAAAAWGAVGVVAGGVGAAVGAFGGGGADKAAGGGADNRDLSSRSVQERETQVVNVINLYPQWATQREVDTFVIGAANSAARSGHQLDPRLLRGAGR